MTATAEELLLLASVNIMMPLALMYDRLSAPPPPVRVRSLLNLEQA